MARDGCAQVPEGPGHVKDRMQVETTATLRGMECVDLTEVVSGDGAGREQAGLRIARSLERCGAVVVQDPRVRAELNDAYCDMMQRYFAQSAECKMRDARPELNFQLGVTPEYTERARDNSEYIAALSAEDRPVAATRGLDPKWRFFWRPGASDNVVPAAFEAEWRNTMDEWGFKLQDTMMLVSSLLAVGLGAEQDTFERMLQGGPHLLAPTGSDLFEIGQKMAKLGKDEALASPLPLAGFHYDLNFLTAHGKSTHGGLYIWTREGKRVPVSVPPGGVLLQAGIQLEILTAGRIQRGYHEVIALPEVVQRVVRECAENRACGWRVSSTVFGHIRSDQVLEPIEVCAQEEAASRYPPVQAAVQVLRELESIQLAPSDPVS
ncbi:hypothetical protein FVE85_7099 [Porphyridium purpureum]|uniref:Isopenicillin N synthase-like Fe(2+) 2OG dioxygenase domain-containing protein n=1 Tax=Porphyridium purpureum TaxID=35688 RepID=A0A5J4Z952_PORPP|nr:hypothetical protein FVE85_7099 [Porphyridium purpureum]|eukprot:POR4727..scf295_1